MSDSIPSTLQPDRMLIDPVPDPSPASESITPAHPNMPHLEPFDRSPRQTGNSLDFTKFSDALSEISNEDLLLDENISISPTLEAEFSNITPTLCQGHDIPNIKSEPGLPNLPNPSTEDSKPIKISLLPKDLPVINENPDSVPDPTSKLTPKNLKRYHTHTRILQDILNTADAKNNSPPPAKQPRHSKSSKPKPNRPTEVRYPQYRYYPKSNRVPPKTTRTFNRSPAPPSYSSTHPQSFNNSTSFSRTFVPPFAPSLPRRPIVSPQVLERLNHVSRLFHESWDSLDHFAFHFNQLKAILRNN